MKKFLAIAAVTVGLSAAATTMANAQDLPRQRARRIEGRSAASGLLRRPEGQLGGWWVRHRVSRQWTHQASYCRQRRAEVLVCPRRAALRV